MVASKKIIVFGLVGKAGVGNGPTKITSIPIDMNPAVSKGSNK